MTETPSFHTAPDPADHAGFMALALAEAAAAGAAGEVPVGAVLVDAGGRVVARARNRVIADNDPTAHAEILLFRKAAAETGNYRLTGATLYVTIEPCIMCMGAAVHARIGRIVYGTEDAKWGGAGSIFDLSQDSRLNHRIQVVRGICRNRCRHLIQDFFRQRRKTAAGRDKSVARRNEMT
jgi:tRNA(Arg) A34 adenosine deaminase TadA